MRWVLPTTPSPQGPRQHALAQRVAPAVTWLQGSFLDFLAFLLDGDTKAFQVVVDRENADTVLLGQRRLLLAAAEAGDDWWDIVFSELLFLC